MRKALRRMLKAVIIQNKHKAKDTYGDMRQSKEDEFLKKKLALLMAVLTVAFSLVACSGITHCKQCDDKVYEDGLCKYHYEVNSVKEKVDSVGKDIFDLLDKE